MKSSWLQRGIWIAGLMVSAGLSWAQSGFDTGMGAPEFVKDVAAPLKLAEANGAWLRLHGIPHEGREEVAQWREALTELKRLGFKRCVELRWTNESWVGGVRAGGGHRLPVDLCEVHARCRKLAEIYADLVDVWEIENEPDISFVEENAETYAAFLKACWLGLRSHDTEGSSARARVAMAPLALPPGPYFEQLVANGLWSCTDVFNFHYYGYADDFSGAYEQFAKASGELRKSDGSEAEKRLPVFLTEYGYGLLDSTVAETNEGRERQRKWFEAVQAQIRETGVSSAMAFVAKPCVEGRSEFGLLAKGSRGDDLVVTPAWNQLWAKRLSASHPKEWAVSASALPEVVMDFLAAEGLEQQKSFNGYFVSGFASHGAERGHGGVVIYNFSAKTVRGELRVETSGGVEVAGGASQRVELAPGERRMMRIVLRANGSFVSGKLRFCFATADSSVFSKWETLLHRSPLTLRPVRTDSFEDADASREKAAPLLLDRPRASEEPKLEKNGRWLATAGVSVKETDGVWSFEVTALPPEPLRPAMVELPLSENFVLRKDSVLSFSYRGEESRGSVDVYFRTANGNLYQVWPRLTARQNWQGYAQPAANFTMAFFGRAELPWRFLENKPVALVFFFRPEKLPAVFEIKGAAMVRWECEQP